MPSARIIFEDRTFALFFIKRGHPTINQAKVNPHKMSFTEDDFNSWWHAANYHTVINF